MSTTVALEPPLPEVPYRGIEAFRFVDQQILAARDDEIWDLVSNVKLYRAVLFYGDSGTGKSSLINAGLLPKMLEGNYVPDRLRVQPFAGREIKIDRIAKSSGDPPTYLPSNFTPAEADIDGARAAAAAESFELPLNAFREELERLYAPSPESDDVDSLFLSSNSRPRPLLIFDQFEEFITLFEEAQRGGPTPEAKLAKEQAPQVQRAILEVLVALIQGTVPVTIIFSFREDYLAKFSSLFDSCPELLDQSQRLLPPSIDDLPKIIRAPFDTDLLQKHFLGSEVPEARAGSELTESLARRIAAALGRRSEGDAVNLTELQIVCLRLWQSLDPETLFRKDGVTGILRGYAADVFGSLPSELREEAVALLSHMVTGSNTRNIISENDLLARTSERTHLPHDQLHETLDELCDRGLMRRERRRDLYFYELASEYFVPWINERVGERDALEAEVKAKETRRKLAQQVIGVRRERRRTRLLRRLLIILAVVFAVLVGVGAYAAYLYKKSVENERQLVAAKQKEHDRDELYRQLRERSLAAITALGGQTDAEKLQALEQIKKWNEEGNFPPEFVAVLVGALSKTENPQIKQVVEDLSRALAQAAKNNPTLAQLIGKAAENNTGLAEKLPPRFYIKIADDSQKPMAQKAANALKQQGYLVPSIQNVGGDAQWDYELRYFRKGEEGMPPASDILTLLKQATGITWQDGYNSRYENSTKIRPGHFEVWFPAPTGQLLVSFVDEDGHPLHRVKTAIDFEPVAELGVHFSRKRPGNLAVRPGNYDVTINVQGFKPLRRSLSMEAGGEVDWSQLKLTREDSSSPR
jgi:predicted negative regulator of RcsB-dependent stress response